MGEMSLSRRYDLFRRSIKMFTEHLFYFQLDVTELSSDARIRSIEPHSYINFLDYCPTNSFPLSTTVTHHVSILLITRKVTGDPLSFQFPHLLLMLHHATIEELILPFP